MRPKRSPRAVQATEGETMRVFSQTDTEYHYHATNVTLVGKLLSPGRVAVPVDKFLPTDRVAVLADKFLSTDRVSVLVNKFLSRESSVCCPC